MAGNMTIRDIMTSRKLPMTFVSSNHGRQNYKSGIQLDEAYDLLPALVADGKTINCIGISVYAADTVTMCVWGSNEKLSLKVYASSAHQAENALEELSAISRRGENDQMEFDI